jgi:serine/threonine protein kinase
MVRVSRGDVRSDVYKNADAKKIKSKQPERIKGRDINLFRDLHDALKDGRLNSVVDERCAKSLNKRNKIGEGGFGSIFSIKLKNDKGVNEGMVVKVPVDYGKKISKNKVREINNEMLSEQKKADSLRSEIKMAIDNDDFASAQALNNVVAPIKVFQIDKNGLKAVLMRKADGNDGIKAINDGKIEGYSEVISLKEKELNDKKSDSCKLKKYHYVDDKKVALSIARQKATLLRGLHECGYVNIDTKLENIMISKKGVVSMIDVGSIVKTDQKNNFSFAYTKETVAPEVLSKDYKAHPKADVFSDAVDRPFILFGQVADKYFDRKSHNNFGNPKRAAAFVKNGLKEYKKLGFESPKFPENFTNAQKARYIYYHLSFKKIQKELVDTIKENAKTKQELKKAEMIGNIYPDKVLHSLALLQTYATDPDPRYRISDREVEEILLQLEMTIDSWKSGRFRVKDRHITLYSLVDEILPKNRKKRNS